MWTTTHSQILTLDNLILSGRPLANRCCIAEFVDHLLLFCPIAHSLWMYMLWLFGIVWVMPGLVDDLLFCWFHWLGKHSSDILDLVPGCLKWTIQSERNQRAFEDEGKIVVQLLEFCQRTLFDWSRCWGFSDCSSLTDFISSIRIDQGLFLSSCFFFVFLLLLLIIFSSYLSKKKKKIIFSTLDL